MIGQVDLTQQVPDFWHPGSYVTIEDDRQYVVKYKSDQESDKIPNSCWSIDHEVTQ